MRPLSFPPPQAGPVQKLLTLVIGIVLLVLGLMFSVVVLIGLIVIGLLIWGYLWWKTRAIRRVLRQAQATTPAANGDVIEGEAVVVDEPRPAVEDHSRPDHHESR